MGSVFAERDRALETLTAEFPTIPIRVVMSVFLAYLERLQSVAVAERATRERIQDACLV